MTKAGEARNANIEESAREKIQVEVIGSYGLDGKIDLEQLKINLKKLNIHDEDIKPTIIENKEMFPVLVEIDNYKFDISEDGSVYESADFKTLEASYGKVVNGYTGYEATDVTEWKLLYVDEENREAFIISSNTLIAPQPTNTGIPVLSKYLGSDSLKEMEYARNYNRLWLEKCTTNSTKDNAIRTAYLCDSNNWSKYVKGKAKYAAGGPTVEILVASYNNKQVAELKDDIDEQIITIRDVNNTGYPRVITQGLTVNVRDKLYNTGGTYWLSSPSNSDTYMRVVLSNSIDSNPCGSVNIGLRPIVCLPASAIEVSEEGENITLNYK